MKTIIKNQEEINKIYENIGDQAAFLYNAYDDNGNEYLGYCMFETDNCPVGHCIDCPWYSTLAKIEREEVPD